MSDDNVSGVSLARELEIRDAVIDEIAGWVGESSLSEIGGILAKRKRVREDAELRARTIREYRAELVQMIVGRKNNKVDRIDEDLRDIAAGNFGWRNRLSTNDLGVAFRLARRGLAIITVKATVAGSYNCSQPETMWEVTLSPKGEAMLAELQPPSPVDQRPPG